MKTQERWLWALAIVVIDLLIFAVPLTAFFAAYLLIARPPWFRAWMERLYQD
jgi:hypothetical protein